MAREQGWGFAEPAVCVLGRVKGVSVTQLPLQKSVSFGLVSIVVLTSHGPKDYIPPNQETVRILESHPMTVSPRNTRRGQRSFPCSWCCACGEAGGSIGAAPAWCAP